MDYKLAPSRIYKFYFGKRLGIPKCFPTLNKTGKQPVPNYGTEPGLVLNIWDAIFYGFLGGKSGSGNFSPVLQTLNLVDECQNISKDSLQQSHLIFFFGWFVNNFFLQNLVKIYTQIKLAKLF